MTTYQIMEPDEWGMRWDAGPYRETVGDDTEIYVHHRAGNPLHDLPADEVFRQMDESAHRKGYASVGYDVLVHENTVTDTVTIGIARGQYRSAATLDRNEIGEAICAIGYFHPGHKLSERPSPGMLEGIAMAGAELVRRGWVAPTWKMLGHRDNPAHPNATACPGDYLYPHVPSIAARTAALLAGPGIPQSPDPTAPPEDYDMSDRPTIIFDGALDQFELVPIGNVEQRRKMGHPDAKAPIRATTDLAALEKQLPYRLTKG